MVNLKKEMPMEIIKRTWERFGEIPIDNNDRILREWWSFPIGTSRFDIWSWFETEFNVSVALDLMELPESEV